MLKYFRNPSPFSIVILILLAIGVRFGVILRSNIPHELQGTEVWRWLLNFCKFIFGNSPILFSFLALFNVILQAILLNQIADKNRLFHHSSLLPAVCYILICSFIPELSYFNAPLVANWFLIVAFGIILNLSNKQDVQKQLFNAGFFISIAALIYMPYSVFVIAVFLSISMLRSFKLSEWLAGILGLVTPIYFIAAYLFLTDNTAVFSQLFQVKISYPAVVKNLSAVGIAAAMIGLWTIVSIFYLNLFVKKMLQQIKNLWGSVLIFTLFAIIATVLSYTKHISGWIGLFPFLALILANPFFEQKKKWVANLLFYTLIASVVLVQWLDMADIKNLF